MNEEEPVLVGMGVPYELGCKDRYRLDQLRESNQAENSHLAIWRRERKQRKFKAQGSSQKFLASHANVYNLFNVQRHLIHRPILRHFRTEAIAM